MKGRMNSIRSQSLVFTFFALTALSLLFAFIAVEVVSRAMARAEEQAARNVLDMVYLQVESEYNDLEYFRNVLLQKHRDRLKDVVSIVEGELRDVYARVQRGELPESQARRQFLEGLRHVRFGNNDYIWVSNYRSVLISHPDPRLHNQDVSDLKDVKGNLIVPPMVAMAREKGEGYYTYWWRRLDSEQPVPKLAYFKHFPEWKWVLGTGVYIPDVQEEVDRKIQNIIGHLQKVL